MSQAVGHQIPNVVAWIRSQVRSFWDLWLTKWHWHKFSPSISVSPAHSHPINCFIFVNCPTKPTLFSLDHDNVFKFLNGIQIHIPGLFLNCMIILYFLNMNVIPHLNFSYCGLIAWYYKESNRIPDGERIRKQIYGISWFEA
jgi:hypothetical protein